MCFWPTNMHFPSLKSGSKRDKEMASLCVNIQLDTTARTGFHSVDPSCEDFHQKILSEYFQI